MIKATHAFPHGFLWGAATSSHQVEGDNTNNDWWAWEQQPGHIVNGEKSGKACDWWGGRWREDFDRAAQASQNAHRLSIEWSRIEPSPAVWDDDALDAYRQLLLGALDRGLMPMVTLHHFTNPVWLTELGGWLNPEIVGRFERYTRRVVTALHDLVGLWVTINEPNVYAYAAYLAAGFPPGEKDMGKTIRVMKNMVMAHAAAYHAIHEIQPESQVGLAHHFRGMQPARPGNPLDRLVAHERWRIFNANIPQALHDGRFRFLGRAERIPQAAKTQDFFGVNYYTVEHVAFDLGLPGELFGRAFYPDGSDLSQTGHIANVPEGLGETLAWARRFGLPIYVTENGVEDAHDTLRPRYLAAHILQVWHAVNIANRVKGYFHWSLTDNFEWERGWTQRFGLWGMDVNTQERIRRPSVDFYGEICKANALTADMVAAYAPEVHESLFPSKGAPELEIVRA
jgi:beta-glucosidase